MGTEVQPQGHLAHPALDTPRQPVVVDEGQQALDDHCEKYNGQFLHRGEIRLGCTRILTRGGLPEPPPEYLKKVFPRPKEKLRPIPEYGKPHSDGRLHRLSQEDKLYLLVCNVWFAHRPDTMKIPKWYPAHVGVPEWYFREPSSRYKKKRRIITMILRLYFLYRFRASRYRTSIEVRRMDLDPLGASILHLNHAKWWATRASRVVRRLNVLLCPQ